jgi:hypothetical protein
VNSGRKATVDRDNRGHEPNCGSRARIPGAQAPTRAELRPRAPSKAAGRISLGPAPI